MAIQFHWRLMQGGEVGRVSRALAVNSAATGLPDLKNQIAYCQAAEEAGIDALLVDIGWPKPDPVLLTAALGLQTKTIKFIIAVRSGLIPPTTFVQQINTLSAMIGGDRILLNVVAGHSPAEQRFYGDFLDHDKRYERTEDFLTICRALWKNDGPVTFHGDYLKVEGAALNTPFVSESTQHPYLFIAGGSNASRNQSITQGDCWMCLADRTPKIEEDAKPVLAAGKDVGLRLSIMARPTREEALAAAHDLVKDLRPVDAEKKDEARYVDRCDSVSFKHHYAMADEEWLSDVLWTGAVRTHGAPSICLVGDADQVAEALMAYRRVGVTQFILSGWPKRAEMEFFGKEVIPRVRKMEALETPAALASH